MNAYQIAAAQNAGRVVCVVDMAAKLDLPYTVLDTVKAASPKRAALTFSACLAADKGYSSRLVRVRGGYDVVASDNRAIAFRSALRIVQ